MRNREPVPAALQRPIEQPPIRLALNPDEAAAALSICSKTLKEMPDGPPAIRIGRRVLYRVASLDAWLAKREQRNDDEPGPASDLPESH
jgi:hypothetical protein